MRFILLLFLMATSLLSAEDWWIYTYEDVGTLKSVFNYLAMVGDDNNYVQTIQTVIIAGMSFVLVFKFLDISAVPKYFVTVTGIMMIVFGTSTTVHIVNVKSYSSVNPLVDNYAVVDNVPYIFAVLSSAFSTIGYNGADFIETVFTSIGDNSEVMENSFLKTGHLGGFKVLEKLNSIDPMLLNDDTKDFANLYADYLNACIFSISYVLDPKLKTELLDKPNIFEYINPSTSPNSSIKNIASQQVYKSDGTATTCSNLYTQANTKYTLIKSSDKIYVAAKNLISRTTSNVDNASSSVISMVTKSDLVNAQPKITSYIMNNGIRSAFENAWMNYGVGTTSSSQAAYGTGLALAQMQIAGKVKSSSAAIVIPTMHSVLQALMYVLFPFVLIVQLFTGGMKILQNYVLGLLWLEFWVPSFSVLNYFTYKEAQTQAVDKLINLSSNTNGPDGLLTIANQYEIFSTIANQAAIAADMYWLVPAIAGFILFASFHSLAGVTSGAAGIIGQYSSNQTLENERAKFSAYEQINEQMKKENPMYTGDIGTISAMQAQSNFSSAASTAGRFLASGSSLNDISKMTKSDIFSGFEQQSSNSTRLNTLSGGSGSIGSTSNTINANAENKSNAEIGSGKAVMKDTNMLDKIKATSEINTSKINTDGYFQKLELENLGGGNYINPVETISKNKNTEDVNRDFTSAIIVGEKSGKVGTASGKQEGNNKIGETNSINQVTDEDIIKSAEVKNLENTVGGSQKYDAYKNTFGNVKDGIKESTYVEANTNTESLKEKINQAGSPDGLVDINKQVAGADVAGKIGEINEANKRGMEFDDYMKKMRTNSTSEAIATLYAKENVNAIDSSGSLSDKGSNVIKANTGSQIESTYASIKYAGGVNPLIETNAKESEKNTAVQMASQDEAKNNGYDYSLLNSYFARSKIDDSTTSFEAAQNAGYSGKNGSMTDAGKEAKMQQEVGEKDAMIDKSKNLNNQDKMNAFAKATAERAFTSEYIKTADLGKANEKAKEALSHFSNSVDKDLQFDRNGKIISGKIDAKTGLDMVKSLETGEKYTSREGTNVGGLTIHGSNGQTSVTQDNTVSITDQKKGATGYNLQAGTGNVGTLAAQITKEQAEMAKDLPGTAVKAASNTHEQLSLYLQERGFSAEEAAAAGYASAGVVGLTAAEAVMRGYNKIMGNMVASEDFNMKTGERYNPQTGEYEDTFRTVKAGEKVDVSKNPDMKQYSEFLKTESGLPMKAATVIFDSARSVLRNTVEKLPSFSREENPLNQTSNTASDSSTNEKNTKSEKSSQNQFHDKAPMSNISEIISQNAYNDNQYKNKSLDEQKESLAKKDPNELAREVFGKQTQMKIDENLSKFQNGSIDAHEFAQNNSSLQSLQSKINNGADITKAELDKAGIKETIPVPTQTNVTPSGSKFQTVDMNAYGEQLKNIEANKIKIAEENMKNFDTNGNPIIKSQPISTQNTIASNNEKAIDDAIEKRRVDLMEQRDSMGDSKYNNEMAKLQQIQSINNQRGDISKERLEKSGIDTKDISFNSDGKAFNTSGLNTPNSPETTGKSGGKVGLAIGAVTALTVDNAIANATGGTSIVSDAKNGNYISAADKTASLLDPTVSGYDTAKQILPSAYNNLTNGNYDSAARDIASIPYQMQITAGQSIYSMVSFANNAVSTYMDNKSAIDNFSPTQLNEMKQNQNSWHNNKDGEGYNSTSELLIKK